MIRRHRCHDRRGLAIRHLLRRSTGRLIAMAWILTMMAWGTVTHAAAPTVTFHASATSVRVAEPLTVEWTVVARRGAKVIFPEAGDQLGDFDVLEASNQFDIPLADAGEERAWTRRMTLETIFAGDQQIPELEIQVHEAGDSPDDSTVLRTQPHTIRVTSVLEDRADPTVFRDIETVVDVELNAPKERSTGWRWWALGGAGGLAVLALASAIVTRRRRGVPPVRWAITELDELKASLDHAPADVSATILRLSDIVEDFLLSELDIPESGHTAHEVIDAMDSRRSIDPASIQRLNDLFTLADRAKFGGLQPSNTDLENAIEDARELVYIIASSEA